MGGHPVIALWSHPRSMSTATERIMRERGDLACFHEPFMYYYYVHKAVRQMPHFEAKQDNPTGFTEIWQMLLDAAERQPVFFKDMSYYLEDELDRIGDVGARLFSAFLIRDPHRSILSYYKLDPALTTREVGLNAQWRHVCWLHEKTGEWPLVLEAEAIQRDPARQIAKFWTMAGLPPSEQAFAWTGEVPEDWKQVSGWHGSSIKSDGIRPPDISEAEAKDRFQVAARKEPRLATLLDEHIEAYVNLKSLANGAAR